MARRLEDTGHSHQEASSPEEIHRLLLSQRFDVLALKVRDEQDAQEIAETLDGVALPPHGILVGRASAPLMALRPKNGGTLRYVPAPLPPKEVSHLVDVSMNAGGWQDEGNVDSGSDTHIQEVEIEEAIESAAAAVYPQAKRKRQRFSTVVEGPVVHALADPVRLQRAVVALLKLSVSIAPRGALVSVEARAVRDEWAIRIRAGAGSRRVSATPQLAGSLQEETGMLTAVSRDIQQLGGLLWVELMGPEALALCLTLPLPAGEVGGDSQ
jgi:hypothetical protein